MLLRTDGLHRAFTAGEGQLAGLLGLGMAAVNRLAPVKHWLAERAQR